jgi:hypothetical protein
MLVQLGRAAYQGDALFLSFSSRPPSLRIEKFRSYRTQYDTNEDGGYYAGFLSKVLLASHIGMGREEKQLTGFAQVPDLLDLDRRETINDNESALNTG